jgi:alkylhydroperoxidase/carboxymuconolactone decarboxylase family protein YurZ
MTKMSELNRQALKEEFKTKRGYWSPWHEDLLALNPAFLGAYLGMTSLPWLEGVLPPKVKEFIYVAIDASTTHLYLRGLRLHMATALQYGATREELMGVLQIVSLLGAHTITTGVPILMEELQKAGIAVEGHEASQHAALKARFLEASGYWDECCDALCKLSPAYMNAYCSYIETARGTSALDPKTQEFILLSISAATTHLHEPGMRLHLRRAIELGATPFELMEVLQLTSALGIHTCSIGVPILTEELKRAGMAVQ